MLGRSAGTIVAFALAASAFVIPEGIAVSASPRKAITVNVPGENAKSLALKLPCSDCVFPNTQKEKVEDVEDVEDGDNLVHIQGSANSVVVNFTVSEDGRRLMANGEPIYPIGYSLADMFKSPKHYVKQVPQSATLEDIASGEADSVDLEITGHGISIMKDNFDEEVDKIIPIKYTIFELQGQPVTIDDVSITLLDTKMNGLKMVHTETTAKPEPILKVPVLDEEQLANLAPDAPPEDFGKHKECKHLPATFCKLRNMIEDRISGMRQGIRKVKGCHGRKGKFGAHHGLPHGHLTTHIRPHFHMDAEDADLPMAHHGRPHHMRPHGHHHGFYHAFSRGLSAVLIPTMAGIAVGMTVSLIGLIVGRLIGFFWIRFYRGGRRGYSSVALDENTAERAEADKEAEDESARTSLESAPPVYEHAPAYEAVEKEVQ